MTTKHVPSWLKCYVSDKERLQVQQTITDAEINTDGEILVMLVRQSHPFGHVFALSSLLTFSIFMCIAYSWSLSLSWHASLGSTASFSLMLAGLFLSQMLAFILSKAPGVKRFLTRPQDLQLLAEARAKIEFYEAGLNQTRGKTGILIFISFVEHRVVVLADQAIASKLPPDTWQSIVSDVVLAVKDKKLGEGLSIAVKRCGVILAEHFPARSGDNPNEHPDHFIIKE